MKSLQLIALSVLALAMTFFADSSLAEETTTTTKNTSISNKLKLEPPFLNRIDLNKGEQLVTVQIVLMRWEAKGGAAARYRISESPSFSGAPWQTINFSINNGTSGLYTLANTVEEMKTIYVQLQNDGGESNILSRNVAYHKPIAPVTLTSLKINNGAAYTMQMPVTITHGVSGMPTHYRACEGCTESLLKSMPWKSYQLSPLMTLSPGDGPKQIHSQIKGEPIPDAFGGAPASNESSVMTASINFFLGEQCFGALGMECGLAYCAGPVCNINAGSWEHDECCWAEKIKGTGKSCISFEPNQPAEVCATSWAKAWNRLTFRMSWTRVVNTNERDTDGKVAFASYCALRDSRVHKDDAKYCCSGKAVQPSVPDANLDARVCT